LSTRRRAIDRPPQCPHTNTQSALKARAIDHDLGSFILEIAFPLIEHCSGKKLLVLILSIDNNYHLLYHSYPCRAIWSIQASVVRMMARDYFPSSGQLIVINGSKYGHAA
jgi:hypothetical protein